MATDPIVVSKVAGDFVDIAKKGIEELGKTKQKETEEKETTKREHINAHKETKQKETEEENSTARHSRNAEKETKIAEISATQDTNKNIMDKAANLIEKSHQTLTGVAEKVKDEADKQIQSANEPPQSLKKLIEIKCYTM